MESTNQDYSEQTDSKQSNSSQCNPQSLDDLVKISRSQWHHVKYFPNFIPLNFADLIYQQCEAVFTSELNKPNFTYNTRQTITYGNPGLTYKLQIGKTEPLIFPVRNWEELLFFKILKPHLERVTKKTYNYCAIVYYPDGKADIPVHRDKEMISGTTIAGLSLGTVRTFKVILPSYSNMPPLELKLAHGSLYTMEPPTNDMCVHTVPAEPEITESRFSLTFRDVKQEDFAKMPIIPIYHCVAHFSTGARKGQLCNAIIKGEGDLCGRHKNSNN